MLTGAGVTRYSSRGILHRLKVGHLYDARPLTPPYEAAATRNHLLCVYVRQDLTLAALAGQDQRTAAGVTEGLHRHVIHRSRRARDRPGQQHMQPKITSRRQVRQQRLQRLSAARGQNVIVVRDYYDPWSSQLGGRIDRTLLQLG